MTLPAQGDRARRRRRAAPLTDVDKEIIAVLSDAGSPLPGSALGGALGLRYGLGSRLNSLRLRGYIEADEAGYWSLREGAPPPRDEAVRVITRVLQDGLWKRGMGADDAPTITDMVKAAVDALQAKGWHLR